jgi:TonB family protein
MTPSTYYRLLILFASLLTLLTQVVHGQMSKSKKDSTDNQWWTSIQITFSYPKKAQENNVQGKVVVSFDIDSTCSIVNVRLVKGIGYGCDEEAIKAVKKMKLTYSKEQGHKCTPRYNLLQTFSFVNNDD